MYRLSYNVYDRAGVFEGETAFGVENKLFNQLRDDIRPTNIIYDVKFFHTPGEADKYIRYVVSGDIVDKNGNKVGHYMIEKV